MQAMVGLGNQSQHIVIFTEGWCSGPVVCVNGQVPRGVCSCDMPLLAELLMAPQSRIERLKRQGLTPTEIQLNSLGANRENITSIRDLFIS